MRSIRRQNQRRRPARSRHARMTGAKDQCGAGWQPARRLVTAAGPPRRRQGPIANRPQVTNLPHKISSANRRPLSFSWDFAGGTPIQTDHATRWSVPPGAGRALLSLILGAIELNRIVLAFRAFFSLLFSGELSAETLISLNLSRRSAAAPTARASDGALQILGILQRDSRLIDFLMEDVSAYTDDQIGAAVRELHDQCRDAIARYVTLAPVIDGVEGTYAKAPAQDAN